MPPDVCKLNSHAGPCMWPYKLPDSSYDVSPKQWSRNHLEQRLSSANLDISGLDLLCFTPGGYTKTARTHARTHRVLAHSKHYSLNSAAIVLRRMSWAGHVNTHSGNEIYLRRRTRFGVTGVYGRILLKCIQCKVANWNVPYEGF